MRNYSILLQLSTLLFLILSIQIYGQEVGLKLHYSFDNVQDENVIDNSGNNYNGTLVNSAHIDQFGDFNILKLGVENGYLDLGENVGELISQLEDFTISTFLHIDNSSNITGNGNFVWAFSTLASCNQTQGKYIAYRVNLQRYALSTSGWGSEKDILQMNSTAIKGEWHHIIYSQSEGVSNLYINGEIVKTGEANYNPKDYIGNTSYNWLGRPHFSGDSYLKGASYADFRIYNRSLTTTEIDEFTNKLDILKAEIYAQEVEEAKEQLFLDNIDAVRNDIQLPIFTGKDITIAWSSSDINIVSNYGKITRPENGQEPVTVTLTATLSKKGKIATKEFQITILPKLNIQNRVEYDLENIVLDNNRCYYLENIKLASNGEEDSQIKWESNNPDYITNSGEIIKLPKENNITVTITATATIKENGTFSKDKEFEICIHKDEGFVGYLFAYFTGNDPLQEQIYFALSNDGYNYLSLNDGNPIISGSEISDKGGVRDPHILRGHNGNFYMVVTDMRSSQGWTSNHGVVLLKSSDLINWTHSKIDLKAIYPEFSNINRAWAPQVIYDEEEGKYMVYFSMKTNEPGSYDIIYYAYTNPEFTEFESVPEQLFYHPENKSCIDGDIIYKDGKYHLFF